VTPEVQNLKADGADVMVVSALGPAVGYALKARSELGWNVPIVFDAVSASEDITKVAPQSEWQGTIGEVLRPVDGCLNLTGVQTMLEEAKQFGGIPANGALDVPGYAWDEFIQVHNAAAQAGSTDFQALLNAENHLNSTAAADPLLILDQKLAWTGEIHGDVLATAGDLQLIPVAPVQNGQVICSTNPSASSNSTS
jgi:hypothetical protein